MTLSFAHYAFNPFIIYAAITPSSRAEMFALFPVCAPSEEKAEGRAKVIFSKFIKLRANVITSRNNRTLQSPPFRITLMSCVIFKACSVCSSHLLKTERRSEASNLTQRQRRFCSSSLHKTMVSHQKKYWPRLKRTTSSKHLRFFCSTRI